MVAWMRQIEGFDCTLELGYGEDAGYFLGIFRDGEPDDHRIGLTLWELVEVSRNHMEWSGHRQLFRTLQAAPVLLKAREDPTDPTAKIVTQLCA